MHLVWADGGMRSLKHTHRPVHVAPCCVLHLRPGTEGFGFCALQEVLVQYKVQLADDPVISTHLALLYDTLLEQNLVRLIEPYSRVQVKLQPMDEVLSGSISPDLLSGCHCKLETLPAGLISCSTCTVARSSPS